MTRYRIVQYESGKYGLEIQHRILFIWGFWRTLAIRNTIDDIKVALFALHPGKVEKIIFESEVKE